MNFNLGKLKIFSFLIYLIILFTNQYYSIENSDIIGFSDQQQYLKIIYASPNFPVENISPYQAYRFLIPYLIGAFLKLIEIDIYYLLIILSIISHLLIINLFCNCTSYIKPKRNLCFIITSAFIFNAYAFRPTLISPFLINDWIFTYGLLLIGTFFIIKKKRYFYFGLIICVLTRQTSLLLNLVFLMIILYNYTCKTKIKTNIYWYGILINILIFTLLSSVSLYLITDYTDKVYHKILLGIFITDYNLSDFINFILRLINTHLFLIVLSIFFIANIKTYKKMLNFDRILILLIGIVIWLQPILGGPLVTGGNIARLTIISMPLILIFFLSTFKNLQINFNQTIMIILLLGISSFHHNYTFFLNIFFNYQNFHYAGLNLLLHIGIIFILFKNKYKFYKLSKII